MKENIEILNKEFEKIKDKGWIESLKNGNCGIGYTLEKILGKEIDSLSFPDYYGIEIKAKHHYSKGYITLFHANPDGDYLFNIEKIQKKYGYPDKIIKSVKVFHGDVYGNIAKKIGLFHYFKLDIDYEKEKIILKVFNIKKELVDDTISWSFDLIKEKLDIKLQYLALVKAYPKLVYGKECFKYYEIKYYKLKDFNSFLKLLENGTMRITFKIGVYRQENKYGKTYNHGTGFDILEKDLVKLYDKIDI